MDVCHGALCCMEEVCKPTGTVTHDIGFEDSTLWCRYKGSMDARSFQHHAARVAELTDTLLAERAADKAARDLATKADPSQTPVSTASSSSPGHAVALSNSPGMSHGPAASAACDSSLGHQTRPSPETAGASAQSASTTREEDQSYLPALTSNRVLSASASSCPSVDGYPASFPPSAEGLAGNLGGSRGPYYCTVCNVSTTSAVHLQTHYMGSKHQRRLAQTQGVQDSKPSQHYCPICAISATSAVHLQLHLNGRAHQRKAKLASEGSAVKGDGGGDGGGGEHAPAALAQSSEAGEMSCHLQLVVLISMGRAILNIDHVRMTGYWFVFLVSIRRISCLTA